MSRTRAQLFVGFIDNISVWSSNGKMLSRMQDCDRLLIFCDCSGIFIPNRIQVLIDSKPNIELVSITDDLGGQFCNWIAAKIDSVSTISTIVCFLGLEEIDKKRGTNYCEEISKRISKAYEIRRYFNYLSVLKQKSKIIEDESSLKQRRKQRLDAEFSPQILELNSEIDEDEVEEAFNNSQPNSESSLANNQSIADNYAPHKQSATTDIIELHEENAKEQQNSESDTTHVSDSNIVADTSDKNEESEKKENIGDTIKLPSQEELAKIAQEKEEEQKRIARQKDLEIQALEKQILNEDSPTDEIQRTISGMESSKAMVVYYAAEEFVQDAVNLYPKQNEILSLRGDINKTFEFITQIAKTTNSEKFNKSWSSYSGGNSLSLDEKSFQYLKRKADELLVLCDVMYR